MKSAFSSSESFGHETYPIDHKNAQTPEHTIPLDGQKALKVSVFSHIPIRPEGVYYCWNRPLMFPGRVEVGYIWFRVAVAAR